jgi:hypothetical protein
MGFSEAAGPIHDCGNCGGGVRLERNGDQEAAVRRDVIAAGSFRLVAIDGY